jgi:hypothetical protein
MFLAAAILTGKVFLDLEHAKIKASIAVPYSTFLINPAFEIHNAGAHVEKSGDDPATVTLSHPGTVEYEGPITVRDDFVELGLDDFWYPVDPHVGETDFRYDLEVTVEPAGYQLVTNGVVHGRHITSRIPDMDIDLVLGRNLDTVRAGQLAIVTKNVPPAVPRKLLADMHRVLDFYNSTFGAGDPEHSVTGVFRPYPTREGQGGYFRKGYFVLPMLTDADAALPNIAHELAHHWWIHASQQNAWLNESFAEYSSMMAMRRVRGQAYFDRVIEEKRKRAAAAAPLPPIYGFDRTKNRRITPVMLYVKGPLALGALEREIGEAKFLRLLRRMAQERVTDTDRLVALIGEVASPRVAADFLQLLKE